MAAQPQPEFHAESEPGPPRYIAGPARGRGPRFRWWWLFLALIICGVLWFFGYHWDRPGDWHQRHFSNPASTGPIDHPQEETTAPEASQAPPPRQGTGPMNRGEASETGNGQAQSTGRIAPQTAPRGNAESGNAGGHSHPR